MILSLRRHPRAAIGFLAALVLCAALAFVALRDRSGTGMCGGQSIVDPEGTPWHCTFDEEFNGSALDAERWVVTKTDQYGFHAGPECYVDDGRHVDVHGGDLILTVNRDASACPVTGSPYRSGMITSVGRFAQTYGRFSFRARLPDAAGVQPALWLYPQQTNYGAWPASGEIDVAEVYGGSAGSARTNRAWPHLHYLAADGQGAAVGNACSVPDLGTRFHTYTVDWGPSEIRFSYDDTTCMTIHTWQPAAPLAQPAPFNAPFFIAMTLALGSPGGASVPNAGTELPATMSVDWVRVWGP